MIRFFLQRLDVQEQDLQLGPRDSDYGLRSYLASAFAQYRDGLLWGDATLAHELRSNVAVQARANSRFLKQMADNALRNRPPLNWLGELQGDGDGGGSIDLKLRGTSPVVDAARIHALASGVTTTNTVDRLTTAGPLRGIAPVHVHGHGCFGARWENAKPRSVPLRTAKTKRPRGGTRGRSRGLGGWGGPTNRVGVINRVGFLSHAVAGRSRPARRPWA